MIHTNKTLLTFFTALLLCFVTLVLAAPGGKGKPPKGNQSVAVTASFTGDIMSSAAFPGELINSGDFDTLEGQIPESGYIIVGGDAGSGLAALDVDHTILPPDVPITCDGSICTVMFDPSSGVTWTIRLDRDKEPENRVQFKMRWISANGFEFHVRLGWVVQFLIGEELTIADYGVVTNDSTSLESATITFGDVSSGVVFRIEGDVEVDDGNKRKKKKTELQVFSRYGETFGANAPWCNMGTAGVCVSTTTIETALD